MKEPSREMAMTVDLSLLTVDNDEQRKHWIDLLQSVVNYHWDMSGQLEPDIKTPNKTSDAERVAEIHRAWARAIQDAVALINMWEIEDESSSDGTD